MTLDEAKATLADCKREELRDGAFGDREVYWMRGEIEVAYGYFGSGAAHVTIGPMTFTGDDAHALSATGHTGRVDQNAGGAS